MSVYGISAVIQLKIKDLTVTPIGGGEAIDISVFTRKNFISGRSTGADVDPGVKVKTSMICKNRGEVTAFLYGPEVVEIFGFCRCRQKKYR
jgi:hypothetical protein